jgi:hypothetical protein
VNQAVRASPCIGEGLQSGHLSGVGDERRKPASANMFGLVLPNCDRNARMSPAGFGSRDRGARYRTAINERADREAPLIAQGAIANGSLGLIVLRHP